MMSAAQIAQALGSARREGGGWRCLCPAHEDHRPSFSVTERNGAVLFTCRSGCDQERVVAALQARGLWPSEREKQPRTKAKPRQASGAGETVYDYRDEFGELRYQVVRRPVNGSSKEFLQRRPNGAGGWIWKMQNTAPLPYRLPELLAAEDGIVFIAEGEKDCDNLAAIGLVATTNHGGAHVKWRSELTAWFAGRDEVVILPDNDDVGRNHAADVARNLAPVVSRVRVLELPGLPPKGDVTDWLAKGGTAEQLLALAEEAPFHEPEPDPPPVGRRFPLIDFDKIELTTKPRCIIDDLIPYDSLCVVWGPPKCGKSFWVFDMLMHVALGWDYRGRHVEQGTVVYIAAEGELGIRARAHAFRQARMSEAAHGTPFKLLTTRLDLVEDIDTLIADLKAQLGPDACIIIVIDTLNRTIHGSESKDDDMGAYRDAADRLRVELNCAVLVIHHCGVDGTRPRGHTGLTGAADAQLAVKKDVDGSVLVTLELMKDGPEGDMMRGRLEVVDVGIDENGKPITSCVVEHLDAPVATERQAKQKKLPPAQARALQLLTDAVARDGEIPPASNHIPAATLCVREELWRRYCYQGGISAGDSQQAKYKAFGKAAEALVAEGRVGAWDDWRWPVGGPRNG